MTKLRRVNFLPPELRPSPINQRNFVVLVLITALGLPSAWLGLKAVSWKVEAKLSEVTAERDRLTSERQSLLLAREQSSEHRNLSSIRKALAEKIYWSGVFRELSNVAPKTLWLTEFETKADANGRSVMITGNSTSQTEVAEFLANLESSFFFRNVQMRFAEVQDDITPLSYKFQFDGRIFDPAREGEANESN